MGRRVRPLLTSALILATTMCGLTALLKAQTSFGSFVGTVTDQAEAAIPGAIIVVTNLDTGISRQTKTDHLGKYRVDSLLPGTYRITAECAGFKSIQVNHAVLPVAEIITVNIQLQIGTVKEKIEVTEQAPQIDVSTGTVGTVVDNKNTETLPLNGRHFTDLLLTVPGSVGAGSYFNVVGGQNYSISGNRADNNVFTIDGVYSNEEFFKQMGLQPSIDAIQEFRVQTNVTSAEYGQGAAANINLAIKSGTNQLHGSLFEFVRNTKFDANDWFRNAAGLPRPQYQRNQYGGVIGGPVEIPHFYDGHHRTFWLFNYEGFRIRRGSTVKSFVPTAAQFEGDLTDQPPVFDPETGKQISCNGTLNVICPDRISSFVKNYSALMYPMIDAAPGASAAEIINVTPSKTNNYQVTVRVDHKIREDLLFFSRFSLSNGNTVTPDALPVLTNTTTNNFRNVVASWTYVANPIMVIDFKLGYNRSNIQTVDSTPPPGWAAFLNSNPVQGVPVRRLNLYPMLLISGFDGPSQFGYPFTANEYQVKGNVSKAKGAHTINAGAELLDMRNLDDSLYTYYYFTATPTALDHRRNCQGTCQEHPLQIGSQRSNAGGNDRVEEGNYRVVVSTSSAPRPRIPKL